MNYVTLANRSSKTLTGTWNGVRTPIPPYPAKIAVPEIVAQKYMDQNPVMGSENPYTLEKTYLLGIEELGHDCSPIEQSDAIERFDRTKLVGALPVEVVRGNGLYSPAIDASRPLDPAQGPISSSFSKP